MFKQHIGEYIGIFYPTNLESLKNFTRVFIEIRSGRNSVLVGWFSSNGFVKRVKPGLLIFIFILGMDIHLSFPFNLF